MTTPRIPETDHGKLKYEMSKAARDYRSAKVYSDIMEQNYRPVSMLQANYPQYSTGRPDENAGKQVAMNNEVEAARNATNDARQRMYDANNAYRRAKGIPEVDVPPTISPS